MMGCPELTAGNKIELTDFGVLSGQWLIDEIDSHSLCAAAIPLKSTCRAGQRPASKEEI